MILEPVVRVLNELERDGWIGRYAIAGAMGIMYYTEPALTYDLDIVTTLPTSTAGLVDLSSLYDHLTNDLGFTIDREHVLIADVPVQFLPAYDALVAEALEQAVEIRIGDATSRVLRYEHLLTILVETGRPKDLAKLEMALESRPPEKDVLSAILVRHGLLERWTSLRGGKAP
ncbi:hypothetical protein JW916_07115 [Candidatus Sumerlaeota bacterium]|nr:hypothetical protein [Candidatus Sumerlaeota bacterium]